MKMCGGTRKMTQRSNSILLAIAVLMIVVVESSITHEFKNVSDTSKENNETDSYLDIKLNFIDSELKEDEHYVQEVPSTESSITDIYPEIEIITASISNENLTDNKENIVKKEDPLNEIFVPEIQNEESTNKIKDKVDDVLNAAQIETTTATPLDETTLVPNIEKTSVNNDSFTADDASQKEEQTQRMEFHQEAPKHYSDLSIYFENEPSQARQSRNFNQETDNEVSKSDDSISNNSKSSESKISPTSNESTAHDENKASENLSSSNEKYDGDSKTIADIEYPNKTMEEELVQEIYSVTESTGEITNDVTTVLNEEMHTIMKKPGVDEISLKNQSIEDNFNEIHEIKGLELDSVVNLVLNRSKDMDETSTNPPTESPLADIKNLNLTTSSQFDNVVIPSTANESRNPEKKLPETFEFKSENEENNNSIDYNVEEIPEQQNNPKSHSVNDEPKSSSNDIHSSGTNDSEALDTDLVKADDNETSTQVPQSKMNEKLVLSNAQEDQLDNGDSFESTTEANIIIETSTEKNIINTETMTNHTTPADPLHGTTVESIPNDNFIKNLDEKSLSEIDSVPHSDTNFSKEHSETSTQFPPDQKQQPSDINNEIFKEKPDVLLNLTNQSSSDSKLFEIEYEMSTERPTIKINNTPATLSTDKKEFGTTSDYAQHVDSLQTMRDESPSVVSDEVIAPASVGRSFNAITAEGLGKPLPTRSVGDEPSSSSYSSEDKTTTVLVLCAAAGGIFIAFSLAIYLISFQRQNGTLDIEMQEQKCGKDNLDDDDDSETRVSLLNQIPTIESDEHSSD